ncbi:hypothetical protein OSTOST_08176 [Ostertagia ostertagi]
MDRIGADFLMVVQQLPIGAEDGFTGVVDLIKMKGIIWHMETEGMTFDEIPVPEDMVEEVNFWRQNLIEAVAEYDEALLEKFFDDPNTISEDEVHEAIRKACIDLSIVPMMCGSSFKNKGVQTALDAVCRYLPSPMDIEEITGTDPDDAEKILTRKPSAKEPFSALAFKIMTDPFVGRLAFFRCYSGHLDAGSYVLNRAILAAAVGFKDIKTGDTLCDEKHPIVLENMFIPEPVIAIAVEPKAQPDVDKMGMAIPSW